MGGGDSGSGMGGGQSGGYGGDSGSGMGGQSGGNSGSGGMFCECESSALRSRLTLVL